MSERRTSVAKDVLSRDPDNPLENYGVARNHFEHARDPSISQQHIDLVRQEAKDQAREDSGSILDNSRERLPEHRPAPESSNDNERNGSKMVKDDQPKNELRPPEEIAKAVDRGTFDKKWFDEQRAAHEAREERESAYDRDNAPEPGR